MTFLSCSIIYLFLVLQLQTLLVLSQTIKNGSVPVGQSLTASESQQFSSSWRSSSGDFAFGFRKIQPNDGFTLSIWFDKIPDKTIVWHAQVNTNTGLVPDGSKITLTAKSGLVLTAPRGQQLWRSILSLNSASVSGGHVNDTGNFGLFSDDSGVALWSSFANPTDTLLPTQSIEVRGNLSSRLSETSFKKGRFRLRLGDDGDLQLLVLNSRTLAETDVYFSYYKSSTTEPNPGIRLVFNETAYMYVLQRENATRFILNKKDPVSSREYYHRAVLHFDGVFALYRHPKGAENSSKGWLLAWSLPDNICGGNYGYSEAIGYVGCGFNNLCTLGDNQRPKCQCPERFSLADSSDEYGDCKPDFDMQTCGPENNNQTRNAADVNLFGFITLERTSFPTGDYDRFSNADEKSCKAACLNDCFCAAAAFDDNQICWKKKFPLSYGQKFSNGNTVTFVKFRKRAEDVPITGKKRKNRDWLITLFSVLLGTSAFVNFIFIFLYRKKKRKKMTKKPNQVRGVGDATAVQLNLKFFTFEELVAATEDFMEELGRGAFGIVYKGILKVSDDSEVTVAVKKLDRVVQEGEKEFINEVKAICQTHHKNLVRLIGFCNEGQSRLIVYEFLPNGTLANFLFRRPRPSWEDRTRILVGTARGILYLHEECCEQIIHCDIKPQNILIDKDNSPRISDFGLAKLLMMNQTHTLTNIRGTKGYVAPEWFRSSPITSKVDVYSYGVMLLEIVCCKKAVDMEDNVILIDWAYDCFRRGELTDLIDGDLEAIEDMETVERYVKIAIWCIQEEPGLRPNMRNVTQMLEGVIQVHDPPNPSPYSTFACYESVSNVQV